jgi:hypothetical protein
MTLHTNKTILDDLWIHCPKCSGPSDPNTTNIGECGTCRNGKIYFRPNCTIFLDQDGVSADFDKGVYLATGKWPKEFATDDEMWDTLNAIPDFFANLPMIEGFAEFYEWIRPLGPFILTACPNSNYVSVAMQKKHWRTKNIPGRPMVLPVVGGKNKGLFMHNVGDILVDDYGRNIRAWEEFGGVGIKHEGTDWVETKARIISVLIDKYLHRQ